MEPELPSLPDHVTTRNGVFQYVRRVPLDIADLVGRTHIQVSLKTRDLRIAKTAAAKLHLHWEAVFERYRSQDGLVEPTVSTADWEAADWQLLAEWIQADILEQDWQKRLVGLTGEQASRGKDVGRIGEAEEDALVEVLLKITKMVPATYAEYRWSFLQERVASLSVRLERMSPHCPAFMAACLRLEVIAMRAIFKRQMQEPMRDVAPHPDEIADKLRARGRLPAREESKRAAVAPVRPAASEENTFGNEHGPDQAYTLMQCVEKWKEQRVVDNKRLTPENQKDKVKAAQQFARVMEIDDVGAITKRHLRRYHDHLAAQNKATSTVNRDVSHITALVKAAERAGWINTIDKAGVYIPVPEGTSERDSFNRSDLEQIFSNVIFVEGILDDEVKAGGTLQYWIPILYLYAGMITTEILQLRPSDIHPHPDFPEILGFEVTELGGGRTKTNSRKRFVPLHHHLIEYGLLNVKSEAERAGREFVWSEVSSNDEVAKISRYFSHWFSKWLRSEIGITDPLKTLYSLRHTFQDVLQAAGAAEWEAKKLMGHADSGMTRRYGRKRGIRPTDIRRLNQILQSADFVIDALVKPLEALPAS